MEHEVSRRCPSEADLTVYYDLTNRGEQSPVLDSIRKHVESCPLCTRKLRSYALMDRLMADVLAAPAGLSERIKSECHRVAEDDRFFVEPAYMKPLVPWWSMALRRAAAVVIGLGVIGGIWYGASRHGSGETAVQVAKAPAPVSSELPATSSASVVSDEVNPLLISKQLMMTGEPILDKNHFAVDQNIVPVGLDTRLTRHRTGVHVPKTLGDAVRHVWMVDDLSASRKVLSQLKDVTVSYASEKNGRLIAHIDGLSDRSLQTVVEGLEKQDWALVSPMLPQPGQKNWVSFNGHPVSYTVWIVEKDR